jgi:hypothetical protein
MRSTKGINAKFMSKAKTFKCPQCLKLFSESEIDSCDECGVVFCQACLTYQGENEELAFCKDCELE